MKGRQVVYYSGLDRIDSNGEYTPDNVVPCCKVCNCAKNVLSVSEFAAWVRRIYSHIPEWEPTVAAINGGSH